MLYLWLISGRYELPTTSKDSFWIYSIALEIGMADYYTFGYRLALYMLFFAII
jgi:hypothetical protein